MPQVAKRKKGTEKIFKTGMTENFPQINVKHKTTDPRISENTKQDKDQRKTIPRRTIFKLHNIKDKEKILKPEEKKKKNTLSREDQR